MERIQEWLLGGGAAYSRVWFEFDAPVSVPIAAFLIILAGAGAGVFWWRALAALRGGPRFTLASLRALALMLILFLALGPGLTARLSKPGDHYVAMVFDDSQSMRTPSAAGPPRGERIQREFAGRFEGLERQLRATFQVVKYRAGALTERISLLSDLSFAQPESNWIPGLREALRDLEGLPVAGVILVSDGMPQPAMTQPVEEAAREIPVPVFTVGADSDAEWRDLRLTDISVNRTNFDKSPVALTAHIAGDGLDGEMAVLEVIQSGRVIAAREFPLPSESMLRPVRMEFLPEGEGWLEYSARVRLAETGPVSTGPAIADIARPAKDRLVENNERQFLIDNRKREYRILYLSGRPNWENKFVRRALEEDPQLRLSSLIRISSAEKKFEFRGGRGALTNPLFEGFDAPDGITPRYDESVFLRLGLAADELAQGYPESPGALFPFHLVIWGDIEADFFSQGHFEVTRDFVSRRGGAFLMLGGPRSFASGHFGGTLIETMLPVMIGTADGAAGYDQEVFLKLRPTVEGFLSGALALSGDPEENARVWSEMPDLYGLNEFPLVRAGASELARTSGSFDELEGRPLLVWQRYGEGRCAVIATGETWQWQMRQPVDDTTHERFWRQMIRSLVKDVAEPVTLRSDRGNFTLGKEGMIEFLVRDAAFEKREGLSVTARITPPDTSAVEAPVEESLQESGVYAAAFAPQRAGMHRISLTAADAAGEAVGGLEDAVLVHPDLREFADPRYNPKFLQDLAKATGGRFFPLEQLESVADAIPFSPSQNDALERHPLWNLPLFFLITAALLCSEWYLRRKRGQP